MFSGAFLRKLREEKNLSTKDLAQYAGVSRTYISLIENGKRQPCDDLVAKLAKYFCVDFHDFFTALQSDHDPEHAEQSGKEIRREEVLPPVLQTDSGQVGVVVLPGMLNGMVLGLIQDTRTLLMSGRYISYSGFQCISGTVAWNSPTKDPVPFALVTSLEEVKVSILEPDYTEEFLKSSQPFNLVPDVIVLNEMDTEFRWYTEYTSLFSQALGILKSQTHNSRIQVLNPKLQGLLDTTHFLAHAINSS